MTDRIEAEWLADDRLQRLLAILSADGEEARIAGGAVRNAVLGQPIADIDIATTNRPEETARRANAAGFKTVPTGVDHGTITVIGSGRAFEVTTLRADVETDGRRAQVVFGRDWQEDAQRRDFTINALYATADGAVVDLVGGVADIQSRIVRFIGDAETRIREDYLRILRFFRFFAWYGSGRPESDGLKACARLKEGLDQLSAERVWAELKRLLAAPDPSRSLLWMRQAGVLTRILPESEKWGIDAIHGLVHAERDLGWTVDPLLRLAAMVPPDSERLDGMAKRLKLSRADAKRLDEWAAAPALKHDASERGAERALYSHAPRGIVDQLRLSLAAARSAAAEDDGALIKAGGYARLLMTAEGWSQPIFPIKGADLVALGMRKGPQVGAALKILENEWIESGFKAARRALLKRAAHLAEN